MRKHTVVTGFTLIALSLIIGACGSSDDDDNSNQTTVAASKSGVMLGPNGEEATPAEEISLSEEDVEELKGGGYKAAIVWHDGSADFSQAMIRGIRDRFTELGIEVSAETDAQFDAGKQQRDVESAIASGPDSIISIPVDPVSAAKAFRPALERGVQLTFLSNIPQGYKHGKDYTGVVSADQVLTGQNTAKIMCDALDGEGMIGVIEFDADFFITNQRDAAFRQALAEDCPGVEISAESGFEDPARVQEIASAMLTRNPDLNGIYTTWAQPAEGVLAALREAGREEDFAISTVDLSEVLALDMADGGATAGVSSDLVYEAGQKLADDVGLGLLNRPAPAFAVVPSIEVTQDGLLDGWQESYEEPAPTAVQDAAG